MTSRANLVLLFSGCLLGGCGGAAPPVEEPEIPAPVIVVSAPDTAPHSPAEVAKAKPAEPEEEPEPEESGYGILGLLNAGQSPIGGQGGLGLSGTGRGGGGSGVSTLSPGTGTGQGYGSGSGRLGKSSRARPPRVRMGATSVTGSLPPEVIQRIVRQNFGRFRLCYEIGLRKDPKLKGKVTVRFTIAQDGRVSRVKNTSTFKQDNGVASCVTRAFYGLTFPQPTAGSVVVNYPIVFSQ